MIKNPESTFGTTPPTRGSDAVKEERKAAYERPRILREEEFSIYSMGCKMSNPPCSVIAPVRSPLG
jgi:hypothetical protein